MLRKLSIPIPLILLVTLLFISVGDRLPQPFGKASLQTRTTLNKAVMGAFPGWRPKVNPYERTQKAVDEHEKSGNSR